MRVCPKCKKTYDDETLNFCLDDGSVLNKSEPAVEEPPPTVMMGETPPTAVNAGFTTEPTQPAWGNPPKYEPHTSSGSKSWIWVLGILGGIILLCGGGVVGLGVIGYFVEEEEPPPLIKDKDPVKEEVPDAKETRQLRKTLDLSLWNIDENQYISASKEGGELILTSQDQYYYVILTSDFTTYDATVKLTLRNPTGRAATLGYGLVIHSDPGEVLAKDYAFLIRSDTKKYRIARHTNQKERNIVGWTRSTAINPGTEENELEVRVNGKDMSFYINGKFVRTEKDFSGYQVGVAGIYTSGSVPIAFSKMEYRK